MKKASKKEEVAPKYRRLLLRATYIAGDVLDALGRFLGALGRLLAASWLSWTPSGSISTLRSSILDPSGHNFGPLYVCVSMLHELLHETHLGISLGLFFSHLQRGGTCAAHGIGAKLA